MQDGVTGVMKKVELNVFGVKENGAVQPTAVKING